MSQLKYVIQLDSLKFIKPTYNNNINLAAQEGLFTTWVSHYVQRKAGIYDIDFNEEKRTALDMLIFHHCKEMKDISEPLMYKISLPTSQMDELYGYLTSIKHKASKLFPGYGGVVKEMEEDMYFNNYENQPLDDW